LFLAKRSCQMTRMRPSSHKLTFRQTTKNAIIVTQTNFSPNDKECDHRRKHLSQINSIPKKGALTSVRHTAMFAIFKKELRSYFLNAIGYVFVGVFLGVAALLCCYTTLGSQSYDTSSYFTMMNFSFIILIPLLTMKLFAEEKKLRTEQLLLTAPVSIWGMVLGKFFAAITLFVGCVLVSCINFFPMYVYGNKEAASAGSTTTHIGPISGEIVACVVGLICLGAAFVAIGMFVSSLTENQLAAAVISISIIVVMLLLNVLNNYIDTYAIRVVIDWFCVLSRFSSFSYGYIDLGSVFYYLSITGVFLLLTVRVYDKRRWG